MIDPRASDMLLYVTAVTVAIGMVVMLFGLLVPRDQLEPIVAPAAASASLAQMIAAGSAVSEATGIPDEPSIPVRIESPPEVVKETTFAAIVAEAKRSADKSLDDSAEVGALDETESGFNIDELLHAPLVENLHEESPQKSSPVVDRSALSKRITWPALVDETAIECDLPTRLRLIEGLSFIGGSWSIDILARAYEQELDASVRGAIFVALRDARSAA